MSVDNESPPGAWKAELERMPWKFTQNQKVHWALAELRIRGMWTESAILANEINTLRAEVEALRNEKAKSNGQDAG